MVEMAAAGEVRHSVYPFMEFRPGAVAVNVTGKLIGGSGGDSYGAGGGSGVSVAATNQVYGSTSGPIALTQDVFGGYGGGGEGGGSGGSALSSLSWTSTCNSLTVRTDAYGGTGGGPTCSQEAEEAAHRQRASPIIWEERPPQ